MEKISSNRSFGLVFFIVFLLISIWPLFGGQSLRIWSLVVSLIFLFLGLLNSKLLSQLNLIWTKFGILLGKIISPIIIGAIFFLVGVYTYGHPNFKPIYQNSIFLKLSRSIPKRTRMCIRVDFGPLCAVARLCES